MNLVERESRVEIKVGYRTFRVPLLEMGCDGCSSLTSKLISTGLKSVMRDRALDSVEESFRETSWCSVFNEEVEGGPCEDCKAARGAR